MDMDWDLTAAERRSGNPNARAVVSVAFSAAEFERVAATAEMFGMKTSTFIREMVLGRLTATYTGATGSGTVFVVRDPRP